MRIESRTTHVVAGDDFLTIESKVNKDKLVKLYGLLSNIYRNPIGSIVREYASNAYDANKEANFFKENTYEDCIKEYPWIEDENFKQEMDKAGFDVLKSYLTKASSNEPIVVGLDASNSGSHMFYVQDYGIGLSPDRMKHIYFNYLDSTKESTNSEIGGFGIGAKSALSYVNTFHIKTVYNGTEYHYIMTKNEFGIPEGQLLKIDNNSNKDNGTRIEIPIKDSDAETFINEIVKQLAYMDNVYINNINVDYRTFYPNVGSIERISKEFNEGKIYDSKYWRYRDNSVSELHLCLENVSYSIDWTELGIRSIPFKVGLKFKTGELQPTPSRESIVYNKASISLIKNRIFNVLKTYVTNYNKINTYTDFNKFMDEKLAGSSYSYKLLDNLSINLNSILQGNPTLFQGLSVETIRFLPFKNIGINIPRHQDFFFGYKCSRIAWGNDGRSNSYSSDIGTCLHDPNRVLYLYEPNTPNDFMKNRYILEKLEPKVTAVIFFKYTSPSRNTYIRNLGIDDNKKADKKIKLYKETIFTYVKTVMKGKYEDIHINPNWEKDYKAGKSIYSPAKAKRRSNDEIFSKTLNPSSGSWFKKDFKFDHLEKHKGIIIYGQHTDNQKIYNLQRLLAKIKLTYSNQFIFITVSKTNCKRMKDIKHAHTYEEVIEDDALKILGKCATAYKISQKLEKNILSCNKLKHICDDINDKFVSLYQYADSNGFTIRDNRYSYAQGYGGSLPNAIAVAATKLGLIDETKLKETKEILDYSEGLDLLEYINNNVNQNRNDSKLSMAIADFLILKNKKVNKEFNSLKDGSN